MLNSALFAIIEEAGAAVMILGEDVTREELMASRLTRSEVQRQLGIIVGAVDSVPADARKLLPEIEWDGWQRLGQELIQKSAGSEEALWFGLRSLVPATLIWLQVYRKNQPDIFVFAC